MNLSPEHLKVSRVTSIHKNGSRGDIKNCKPILTKVFEKIMNKRLVNLMPQRKKIYIYSSSGYIL